MSRILEKDIEELIEKSLIEDNSLQSGYRQSASSQFDRDSCLNKTQLIEFLESTQKDLLDEFKKINGKRWENRLLDTIDTNIKQKGLIEVLRKGIEDYSLNENLQLIYFKPNNKKNDKTLDLYKKNIFSLTRQLYFEKTAKTSIDLCIFINGFPLVILELKNQDSGQNTKDAEKQFKLDRSYKTKLSQFNTRTLIYFALDTTTVSMCTELKGKDTFFLPFNKGNETRAGNPIPKDITKLQTHYLWEEILLKDSLLDIFRNFYFIKVDDKDPKKKTAIFPRYHQLDVVKNLVEDVKFNGTGEKYLIQHSAGSGKTNSISWLTHKLSKLSDKNDNKIFDSVIVITDRKILDKQLQDAIYQLDKTKGLVVKIDKNKNSTDLADAIKNGAKIIITTIQKFSHAYPKIDMMDKKKYAIIIDEAHSSTSGENMNYLKQTLAGKTLDEAKSIDEQNSRTTEDEVNEILDKITDTNHISFFAFTATPKDKTMQIFGKVGDDDLPHEFHLYSMQQAIEEGFILDTLKNYMVSDTYFNIAKKIKDNPMFDKSGANRAIGTFINLHEHNIEQKVKTIVEDFMSNRSMWIDGKSKAMIVTSSRLHALRYKLQLDEYLAEHYPYIKSLIAFSGELEDGGLKYTEESLNGIKESQLPDTFDEEKSIKFLIVADKYQTGFDQPKLCAMYVDKMLSDVKAVQTFSRLNRTMKDKTNTFILDFVNDIDGIKKSFAKYYTQSNIKEVTEPNIVFEFYHKIDEFRICYEEDIKKYTSLYLEDKRTAKEISTMDNLINQAIERFKDIETVELQDEFKTYVIKFFRAYNFLIQIYPIKKVSLYMLYIYLGGMIRKFPKDTYTKVELDELLSLDFYKLKKINGDGVDGEDISFGTSVVNEPLAGYSTGSSRTKIKDEEDLDSLIDRINKLFGLELSDEDRLAFFDQPLEAHKTNNNLKDIAKANSYEEFEDQFQKGFFIKTLLEKKSKNEEVFHKILSDNTFKSFMIDTMSKELYRYFNE